MAGGISLFSWVFLVELLAFGLVAILFVFYFNPFFAFLISQLIRAYTWHQYQVHIEFKSLQFSLLGGRIFFKSLRYHGENETVLVHDGHITWRYWLRWVRHMEVTDSREARNGLGSDVFNSDDGSEFRSASGGEQGGKSVVQKLPCRIAVEARGLEWFIYNRSSAYDTILDRLSGSEDSTGSHRSVTETETTAQYDPANSIPSPGASRVTEAKKAQGPPELQVGDDTGEKSDGLPNNIEKVTSADAQSRMSSSAHRSVRRKLPFYSGVFPVAVQCTRGALVMGNENTHAILVAKFDSAKGLIEFRNSGPQDLYRQCFDFNFDHPIIDLKPNQDFGETQLDYGSKLRQTEGKVDNDYHRSHQFFDSRRTRHAFFRSIGVLIPYFNRSVESMLPENTKSSRSAAKPNIGDSLAGHNRWLGLSRYLDADADGLAAQERWRAVEYASSYTIVDSPAIAVSFFWDVPGVVLPLSEIPAHLRRGFGKDINGSKPPEWGLDLKVNGGTVNYGPWADRQRNDFQAIFFPSLYADTMLTKPLAAGQTRISTIFRVLVELEKEVTLRIPTREESKDWRWKGHASTESASDVVQEKKKPTHKRSRRKKASLAPEIRPPGWLSITVAQDSFISYSLDMVASGSMFHNRLHVDLKSPEMSSSVNHGLLWRAQSQTISCDLSNPLKWNALRNWSFEVQSEGVEVFILRDHVFLLTDLISDWASGPSGAFSTFVPFQYNLRLLLPNFKLYLNVNDSNIINNPSDLIDNAFVVVWGNRLNVNLNIPLDEYRPLKSKVTFDVDAFHGGFSLCTPTWNTQHTLLDSSEVATLKDLRFDGYYSYCTSITEGLTDTLVLNLQGIAPTVHLYGFLIRYFIKIKDNYFGEDLHFQTLEEYQQRINKIRKSGLGSSGDDLPAKISNDLDVILVVTAENACLMLPANLYSASDNIKVDISSIALDVRFTNYYMDLEASFSPLAASRAFPDDPQTFAIAEESSSQIFIDGLVISSHRLFGLPPAEPTYVCNWDFAIGQVKGETSIEVLSTFFSALKCIAFTFGDDENALPPFDPIVIHDVTFLRAKIEPIRVWVHVQDSVFLFSTDMIKVEFNDWAGVLFSDRVHLSIPRLTLACVDSQSASRHRTQLRPSVITWGFFQTSIDVRMVGAGPRLTEIRQLQQDHIGLHDIRTGRTPWLIQDGSQRLNMGPRRQGTRIRPPVMPYPLMPKPVTSLGTLAIPSLFATRKRYEYITRGEAAPRQSSFLSTASEKGERTGFPVFRKHSKGTLQVQSGIRSTNSSLPYRARSGSIIQVSRKPSHYDQADIGQVSIGPLPPNITFASSYEVPYFPLQSIEPDLRDVPVLPEADPMDPVAFPFEDGVWQAPEVSFTHTTFMVRLNEGIRILCTPQALQGVNNALEALQPKNAATILDEIQLGAMADVQNKKKDRFSATNTLELRLEVPSMSLRFTSSASSARDERAEYQTYDLAASRFTLNGRLTTNPVDSLVSTSVASHLSLKWLGVVVHGKIGSGPTDSARIDVNLCDVTSWLVKDQVITGETRLKELETVGLTRDVASLAALLNRTTTLVENIPGHLKEILSTSSCRQSFLVHRLTTLGENLTDPALLTSASYVLRSAVDHPRSSDTWKMISRLRYVLQCLPPKSMRQLSSALSNDSIILPDNAMEEVIAYFNQWRSWDLDYVRASSLIFTLFGSPTSGTVHQETYAENPVQALLKIENIRLVLEPGSGQNEIIVNEFAVKLGFRQTSTSQSAIRTLTVDTFCSNAQLHLNWNIFELVEGMLPQRGNLSPQATRRDNKLSQDIFSKPNCDINLSFVVKRSNLAFNSINLKGATMGHGIKASFMLLSSTSDDFTIVCTLTADMINSELSSQAKLLMTSKMEGPSIYASLQRRQERSETDIELNIWKLAALCKDFYMNVEEDLLGLLGIIDTALGDEVAYLYQLLEDQRTPGLGRPLVANSIAATKKIYRLSIVLLLDSYTLTATVLSTLRYSLGGQVARTSVRTSGRSSYDVLIDFDVKNHSHAFLSRSKETSHEIAKLRAPPINGRVHYSHSVDSPTLSLFLSVEKVILDASAVYALLSTISHSEISTFRRHLEQDIQLVQSHFKNILQPARRAQKSIDIKVLNLSYNVRATAAGLIVNTISGRETRKSAHLGFELNSVYLHMSNKNTYTKQILLFPEMRVNVSGVRIYLERIEAQEVYPCGEITLDAAFHGTSRRNDAMEKVPSYQISSARLEINLYTETASILVDIFGHLQNKFKTVDFSQEVRSIRAKRRFRRHSQALLLVSSEGDGAPPVEPVSANLFTSMYSLELSSIEVSWRVGNLTPISPSHEAEDLILSIKKIDLATERGNAARLIIEDFQLQMVPVSQSKFLRSYNSALLPEVVFNVAYLSTPKDRRLALRAAGKSLDLRLTSRFILPASHLQRSMALASDELRKVVAGWNAALPQSGGQSRNILGKKRFSSLLVDADFAGAVVYIQGRKVSDPKSNALSIIRGSRLPQHGRYGQFTSEDASSSTTLRAPGLAWKIEYKDVGLVDPSLNAEIRVDASTNVLYPAVVPLILEISSSIKEIVGETEEMQEPKDLKNSSSKFLGDDKLKATDPTAILGNCSLNLGLRICRQEFSLSCQPIAKVAATAQFEDIYITVNTVQAADQRFFAVGAVVSRLQASVQHVYSRESTGSFDMDSISLSLMNSKHVSNVKGLSAILKFSPMSVTINAKQLHDFLLFREIWVPLEMRHSNPSSATMSTNESQAFVVQRYQQVAATGSFRWDATLSMTKLEIQLDLGQAVGKSTFVISGFWVSSKKTSDWEQNLCLGFDKVGMDSTGRMSGFIELQKLCLRTSIKWSAAEEGPINQTPLIQASLNFDDLRIKAVFDYQPFLVADLLTLDFLMYNVRDIGRDGGDRLVAIVNGDKVQAFITTTSSAHALALYQAIQRLIQEKQAAYESSLKDIEKYLRRNSSAVPFAVRAVINREQKEDEATRHTSIQLHTSVVITLKAINIGAYPSTFFDHQIFKLEALNALARFTVSLEHGKVRSGLGLTLGQLRIALSVVANPSVPKTLGDVTVDEVIKSATGSRGGTVLKVPKVVASMQTWQIPGSNHIDYIFRSSFEGKVEVGWNYARISFIRGMWSNHSRALAQRLGKPLPPSALQITGGPRPPGEKENGRPVTEDEEKITAIVHVPPSKYDYTALEPPIIETPQLRDMGEATPPLEWIGLQRERLPNLTHQIVIVSLLEVAREVEDAYSKILGSS